MAFTISTYMEHRLTASKYEIDGTLNIAIVVVMPAFVIKESVV